MVQETEARQLLKLFDKDWLNEPKQDITTQASHILKKPVFLPEVTILQFYQ